MRRERCAPTPPAPPCTASSSTRAARRQRPPSRSGRHQPRQPASRRRDTHQTRLPASAAASCPASCPVLVRYPLVLSSYRTTSSRFLAVRLTAFAKATASLAVARHCLAEAEGGHYPNKTPSSLRLRVSASRPRSCPASAFA